MLKIRYVLIVLGMLLCSVPIASAQVSVNIGINLPTYPRLVVVPGSPAYYAPGLQANFFFYDGMYWVYQDDNWYSSSWYNGPWWIIGPEAVPLYVLRIPVRYYRQPPAYFRGWRSDAPPRWGNHWGHDWEQSRQGWDRRNRSSAPAPAPLPSYQRKYSGERYPQHVEQQQLQQRNYRYQPRDPVVRQHYQEQRVQRPSEERGSMQQAPRSQGRDERQQGRDATRGSDRR